ncbi:MAG: hypothetical protein LH647_18935 [Leptolyngbyaceae cyanobacterium CAN_BIN12]|nr:hypothetical protein [Leptolyngbyaceae cyanobacterium CAN_BIN12]
MLIDSNNDYSTLPDLGHVRCAADLARSSTTFQSSSVSDRSVVPSTHPRSPLGLQDNISDLQALRQTAYLGEQQKRRSGSIRKEAIASFDIAQPVGNFAAPLSPLRERDLAALSALFSTDTMSAIEADVAQLLIRLQPEPCWEDDPFAFLQNFV